MDPTRFTSERFGTVTREPGNRAAFYYFLPAPIPRALELDPTTIKALSDADSALGLLNGLGRLIKDPQLLVGPYITREAVASSRIEGTEASLSDVLKAEAGDSLRPDDDVAEVERYIAATRAGLRLRESLPISQRFTRDLHRILLSGVRGKEKLPGEFRRSPVWVGSATDKPDSAAFVPPLPEHIGDLFADWERFVNEPCALPPLIQCALMHYQFETIHPFLDGNGRIGRLLIILMLMQEERLTVPILYLSGYLEQNRREYYDRLQGVREVGDIQGWLQFFLTAVQRQATDAVDRAGRLIELREQYLEEASKARSRLSALVQMLFQNPYITVARAQRDLGLTNQGARNLIREAERRGWLEEVGSWGRGGRVHWFATEIFQIIEAPLDYTV